MLLQWLYFILFLQLSNIPLWASLWLSGKEPLCQCRRCRFDPWVRKIPWKRRWQLTPVFLPEKSRGQKSLESLLCPWDSQGSHLRLLNCRWFFCLFVLPLSHQGTLRTPSHPPDLLFQWDHSPYSDGSHWANQRFSPGQTSPSWWKLTS